MQKFSFYFIYHQAFKTLSLSSLSSFSLHGCLSWKTPLPATFQPPKNHKTSTTYHPQPPLSLPQASRIVLTSFASTKWVFFHLLCWFCFWFLILLVFVSYFGCFSDILCCFYGINNHLVDGLWWSWGGVAARVRVSPWSWKLLVQVMFIAYFILVFAYLPIYWRLLYCLCCFEKLGVSLKWPKVRVLSKMQDSDQLMVNLRCVCICD